MMRGDNFIRNLYVILGVIGIVYVVAIILIKKYLGIGILISGTIGIISAFLFYTLYTYLLKRFIYKDKSKKEILFICKSDYKQKRIIEYSIFVVFGAIFFLLIKFYQVIYKTTPLLDKTYIDNLIAAFLIIGAISVVFSWIIETIITVRNCEKS